MRILVVSPHFPAFPGTGSAARVFCLLRETSRRHEVHLVTGDLYGGAGPPSGLEAVCRVCTVVAASSSRRGRAQRLGRLLDPLPEFARTLQQRGAALRQAVAESLRSFRPDVVHIVHSVTAPILDGLRMPQPVVIDAHDIIFRLYEQDGALDRSASERASHWLQTRKMRLLETSLFRGPYYVLAMTEADRDRIRSLAPAARVAVVPNGVDTDYFGCAAPGPPERLIYTGNLASRPNQDAVAWFVEEVLPRLRRARSDVRFEVVGADPPPLLRQLCDRHGVPLHASVDDVRPYLHAAGICVVSLRLGSGSRLKILEALASGRPVVSTRLGAEGLELRDREHLLLADGADDFAERVLEAMRDEELRARLARGGRARVEERYDWRALAPALDRVYEEILSRRPGCRPQDAASGAANCAVP